MSTLTNYIKLTRANTLINTGAVCVLVFAYAHFYQNFSIFNFLLFILAVCSLNLGLNLFDTLTKINRKLSAGMHLEEITFESFVSDELDLIKSNIFSLKDVNNIVIILFSIFGLILLYFILCSKYLLFLYLAIILGLFFYYFKYNKFFYTDIISGFCYGPMLVTGGVYALTNEINFNIFLISCSIFIANVVWKHTVNIMNWEFLEKTEKPSICKSLKSKEKAIDFLKYLIIGSYFVIFFGFLIKELNPKMFYVFLTLPIATKLLESIKEYINIIDVKFQPRWYWGLFENWKDFLNRGIAFYMFRYYLARNFTLFFTLFAALGIVS